jgi:low temperature requirement protein LtrA
VSAQLIEVAIGGLILVFGLWWAYFKRPARLTEHVRMRVAFMWGYGHYVVFASAAALGAGLQVAIDNLRGVTSLTAEGAALTVAIPVAIYLVAVGAIHTRLRTRSAAAPIVAAVVGLSAAAALAPTIGVAPSVLLMAGVVTVLVAVHIVWRPGGTLERA